MWAIGDTQGHKSRIRSLAANAIYFDFIKEMVYIDFLNMKNLPCNPKAFIRFFTNSRH